MVAYFYIATSQIRNIVAGIKTNRSFKTDLGTRRDHTEVLLAYSPSAHSRRNRNFAPVVVTYECNTYTRSVDPARDIRVECRVLYCQRPRGTGRRERACGESKGKKEWLMHGAEKTV
jgi:hypothetical protein